VSRVGAAVMLANTLSFSKVSALVYFLRIGTIESTFCNGAVASTFQTHVTVRYHWTTESIDHWTTESLAEYIYHWTTESIAEYISYVKAL
jgi:hypothetical protein